METGTGDAAVGSGGRLAGGTFESDAAGKSRPVMGWGAGDESWRTSERKNSDETSYGSGDRGRGRSSDVKGSADGRLRLKWGLDVDIPVRILFVSGGRRGLSQPQLVEGSALFCYIVFTCRLFFCTI